MESFEDIEECYKNLLGQGVFLSFELKDYTVTYRFDEKSWRYRFDGVVFIEINIKRSLWEDIKIEIQGIEHTGIRIKVVCELTEKPIAEIDCPNGFIYREAKHYVFLNDKYPVIKFSIVH